MFTIEMLPAAYGDCLWVEYGDPGSPRRLLVDGGIAGTYAAIVARARQAIEKYKKCVFELLVVSHVDIDHIDGLVKFLANLPPGVEIKEIWFNGWDHLPAPPHSRLGGPSGEMLTALIHDLHLPWNQRLNGGAVVVPDKGPVQPIPLEAGMVLTLLSPTLQELKALRPKYAKECEKAGLIPGSLPGAREALLADRRLKPRRLGATMDVMALAQKPFTEDAAPTNGSSIALLAEFDGKVCLLAADGFPSVIAESISKRLGRRRLRLDAFKLAHHGSRGNTSPELLQLVQASRYLIPTDGAIYHHPDRETIARILSAKKTGVELFFNYVTEENKVWGDNSLQKKWNYQAHFPKPAEGGIKVELG